MKTQQRWMDGGAWFLLGLMVCAIATAGWSLRSESKVEWVLPLGVLGTQGGEGAQGAAVWVNGGGLETALAYYPLLDAVSLDMGTSLVLLTAHSGRRLICDERREVCARTSRQSEHLAKAGGAR